MHERADQPGAEFGVGNAEGDRNVAPGNALNERHDERLPEVIRELLNNAGEFFQSADSTLCLSGAFGHDPSLWFWERPCNYGPIAYANQGYLHYQVE